MGIKINVINNKSNSIQSRPKYQSDFCTADPCTLNAPNAMAAAAMPEPINAHFTLLLSKKLTNAKKKAVTITTFINICIDTAVYISLNSGVVNFSGNTKQTILDKASMDKKIEIYPLIWPLPICKRCG